MSSRIHYEAPLEPMFDASSRERAHLMLLHIDAIDAAPSHLVILAWPIACQRPFEPKVGRPLRDWPQLRVVRVLHNATPMCARRLLRCPQIAVRLCPICSLTAPRRGITYPTDR